MGPLRSSGGAYGLGLERGRGSAGCGAAEHARCDSVRKGLPVQVGGGKVWSTETYSTADAALARAKLTIDGKVFAR